MRGISGKCWMTLLRIRIYNGFTAMEGPTWQDILITTTMFLQGSVSR